MKKKVVALTLAGSLMLASAGAGAFAASNMQSIKAFLNLGIKFKVEGSNWTPTDANGNRLYPITYNNTTYLPVRATGDALGVDIVWDSANNTIKIGEGNSSSGGTSTPPSTNNGGSNSSSSTGLSQDNPAPVQTAVNFSVDDSVGNFSASAYVSEVYRGETAKKKVLAANMFNPEPAKGSEYILFKVVMKVTQINGSEDKVYLSEYDFDLITTNNEYYERQGIVNPEPQFYGEVKKGETVSGYIAFLIEEGDNPLLAFNWDHYYGTADAWFKLTK